MRGRGGFVLRLRAALAMFGAWTFPAVHRVALLSLPGRPVAWPGRRPTAAVTPRPSPWPSAPATPNKTSSGWQPPKDTGLWDIATRIKGEIETGMTPEQKEYWEAEGGYFDQV